MILTIDAIDKNFGQVSALSGLSLEVRDGEFLAVLGPSGAGKTTLLRVLAGLDTPDRGRVLLGGRDFLALSARERNVGLVFQRHALFGHMTVARNVAFGLEVRPRRPSRKETRSRVRALLALTRIEDLADRYPSQLSGGQSQRVALARALAVEPRLLLLDEPFGALDAKIRRELRGELRRIHDVTNVTTVFVTHDQEEAMALADRVALLNAGRVEQIGAPVELECDPLSPFVFEFLGQCNRLPCEVVDGVAHFQGFAAPAVGAPAGKGVGLFRPYDTLLDAAADARGLPVRVGAVGGRGLAALVECEASDGSRLAAEMARSQAAAFEIGTRVHLTARRVVVENDTSRGTNGPQ
jgi:sulfate transport system ATP-binding protein